MQEELVNNLIEQAKNYDEALLEAGLTVLSKDVAEYLAATGRIMGEPEVFFEVYSSTMESERAYGEKYGSPLFSPLEQAGLPKGFAQAAVEGKPDLSPLGNKNIVHEWTMRPGKKLFEKFKIKFKETISGKTAHMRNSKTSCLVRLSFQQQL